MDEMRTKTKNLFEIFESVICALVAVVLLLTFAFRVVTVSGSSMEPTLSNMNKVVISHLFYKPKTGDVIVLDSDIYPETLIKRLIATEGQTVDISAEDGSVTVDGVKLDEPYIMEEIDRNHIGNWEYPVVVPPGKVFVMGDNRPVSMDSRHHEVGLIDVDNIIGKAQLVIIPHTKDKNSIIPTLDFSQIRYLY